MLRKNPIRKLLQEWFPTGEDTVWKAWVDTPGREWRDLHDLVASGRISEAYKARALTVLFAPNESTPVYWKKDEDGESFGGGISLREMSGSLLRFFTELLTQTYEELRRHLPVSEEDQRFGALCECSKYALELLARLPVEEGARIWPYFDIDDAVSFWNMYFPRGYRRWWELMSNENVSMHWKRLADDQFRAVIEQELSGKRKPRNVSDEDLPLTRLPCYVDYVLRIVWGADHNEPLAYDVDLLADQLGYILSKDMVLTDCNIMGWLGNARDRIVRRLDQVKHRGVLQKLAWIAVDDTSDRWSIYDEETLQTAEMMVAAFDQDNDPVAVSLRQIIEAARPKLAERQQQGREQREREQSILRAMRP